MNIENLVSKHNGGSSTIKVESNEAMEEFYKKYDMSEICEGIEKTINSKHKGVLKTFVVERTHISSDFAYVKFKYSVNGGFTDSFEDYLCESVQDVVSSFGFKVKIQYLEEGNVKG